MFMPRVSLSQPRQEEEEKSHLIMLPGERKNQMEKTQLLLLTHNVPNDLTLFPQYLGHIQCRQFFKFIPRTYLQTAG